MSPPKTVEEKLKYGEGGSDTQKDRDIKGQVDTYSKRMIDILKNKVTSLTNGSISLPKIDKKALMSSVRVTMYDGEPVLMVDDGSDATPLRLWSADPEIRRDALLRVQQAIFENSKLGLDKMTATDVTPEMFAEVDEFLATEIPSIELEADLYTQRSEDSIDGSLKKNKRKNIIEKIQVRYGEDVQLKGEYGRGLGGNVFVSNAINIKFPPLGIDESVRVDADTESEELYFILKKIDEYKAIQPRLKQLSKEERELFDKYVSNANKPSDVLDEIIKLRQQ
jgi:hypothetical protein